MAKTSTHLYRSLMGKLAQREITNGLYPGDGVLDPRWTESERWIVDKNNPKGPKIKKVDPADVDFVVGNSGLPKVQPGGGTSLHDVSGWFRGKEFWIPEGTEYSDEIYIRRDKYEKTSQQTGVTGRHYQLEVKTAMTQEAFQGYLNNMARAAVVRQIELATQSY